MINLFSNMIVPVIAGGYIIVGLFWIAVFVLVICIVATTIKESLQTTFRVLKIWGRTPNRKLSDVAFGEMQHLIPNGGGIGNLNPNLNWGDYPYAGGIPLDHQKYQESVPQGPLLAVYQCRDCYEYMGERPAPCEHCGSHQIVEYRNPADHPGQKHYRYLEVPFVS